MFAIPFRDSNSDRTEHSLIITNGELDCSALGPGYRAEHSKMEPLEIGTRNKQNPDVFYVLTPTVNSAGGVAL